jgi:acyl-CoA thioester hydrolase
VSATRQTRVRVRYADTDQMGVVYYANYLIWFEIARTEWLRETGWTYRDMEVEGLALPVIEAHCVYRQPARYDDDVRISTRASMLTAVRLRFDYELGIGENPAITAAGHTVHATVDRRGRPCRLPARLRDLVGGPENGAGRLRPGVLNT